MKLLNLNDSDCERPCKHKKLYNICTMLVQRLRRWTNIVQMLYKCLVFTGRGPVEITQAQQDMVLRRVC